MVFWGKVFEPFSQTCSDSAHSQKRLQIIWQHNVSWLQPTKQHGKRSSTGTNSSNNIALPAVMWPFRCSECVSNQWVDHQSCKLFLGFPFILCVWALNVSLFCTWDSDLKKQLSETWFWLIHWCYIFYLEMLYFHVPLTELETLFAPVLCTLTITSSFKKNCKYL